MLTTDLRNDLLGLINNYNSADGYGFGASAASGAGDANEAQAPFQLLLAQMLMRLLERLETTPASAAATSGNPLTSGSSASASPVWIYPTANTTLSANTIAFKQAYGVAAAAAPANIAPATPEGVMALADYPRPPADNGRGMHWIPTVSQSLEAVDRFVQQLKEMHIKWVPFLNDGAAIGANDYLVQQLKTNGMEPVLRVYTPGVQPLSGDLGAMVQHYKALGVSYFQLYNEPNHSVENDGQYPDVNRYLDAWIPAAKAVIDNGGLPGFGALSPGGEFKDTEFLSQAIDGLRARGEMGLLDKAWLASHNYQGDRALEDTEGFTRFRLYADILQQKLGRVLPIIGTEGGTFVSGPVDEARRTAMVTQAYRYMAQREPYNFAYSYWVVANQAGGGHDPAWEWQALIHSDGQSDLVNALKNMEAA